MTEMSNLENIVSSGMTTTLSNRTTLRNFQPHLSLQKNFGFERCLWEENSRFSYSSVVPRYSSAWHLLPLTSSLRLFLVANSVQGRKLFLYGLFDLVEGLDKSGKLLVFENSGLDVLESFSQHQLQSFVKTVATQLYAIPSSEVSVLESPKIRNIVTTVLLRVLFLLILREANRADQLLQKLKGILAIQKLTTFENSVALLHTNKWSYARFLRHKQLEANQLPAASNLYFSRFLASRIVFGQLMPSFFIKKFIWKRSGLSMPRDSFYNRIQHGYRSTGHRLALRDSSESFLYMLRRLDDKYKELSLIDSEAAKRVLAARNYLIILAEERVHRQRQTSLLLTRPSALRLIRRRLWRNLLAEALVRKAQRTSEGSAKMLGILFTISSFLTSSSLSSEVHKNTQANLVYAADQGQEVSLPLQRSTWRRNLRVSRQPFVNKKIVEIESAYPLKNYADLISKLTGREVSVFFVNALALTRFAFQGEGKGKSSQRFLQNIDREMVSRYKYVAVYIQDFIRVSFIALFLKKPTFLVQFMALQISKLPRNRKETKMLRFLIKVVKVFAAQRREVVGLRIAFKGRVNRWRRTKQIVGEKGILPLQSINTRIEFGSAKAVTRKGTLGIRLWICYNPVFRRELRKSFLDYIEYSQQLRYRSIYRFLGRMQPRTFFEVK
jgi:hypothetical protein